MSTPDPLTILMLASLHRKVDRIARTLSREEQRTMKIQDLLDTEGAALDQLSTDDAAVIAKLNEIEQSGGELTADQAAEAQTILSRIAALDAADVAAVGTTPAAPVDGTGDGSTGTTDGTTPADGTDVPVTGVTSEGDSVVE